MSWYTKFAWFVSGAELSDDEWAVWNEYKGDLTRSDVQLVYADDEAGGSVFDDPYDIASAWNVVVAFLDSSNETNFNSDSFYNSGSEQYFVAVTEDNGYDFSIKTQGWDDFVLTTSGDDIIQTRGGKDIIIAGYGSDSISAGAGDDWILAGADDAVWLYDWGNDTIDGGAGNDTIYATAGDNTILAGDGDDTVYGFAGDDYIEASADEFDDSDNLIDAGRGDDTIIGADKGADTIYGGAGSDVIFTGAEITGTEIVYGDDDGSATNHGDFFFIGNGQDTSAESNSYSAGSNWEVAAKYGTLLAAKAAAMAFELYAPGGKTAVKIGSTILENGIKSIQDWIEAAPTTETVVDFVDAGIGSDTPIVHIMDFDPRVDVAVITIADYGTWEFSDLTIETSESTTGDDVYLYARTDSGDVPFKLHLDPDLMDEFESVDDARTMMEALWDQRLAVGHDGTGYDYHGIGDADEAFDTSIDYSQWVNDNQLLLVLGNWGGSLNEGSAAKEYQWGTQSADVLYAYDSTSATSDAGATIYGWGGSDIIEGNEGDDRLYGGDGGDYIDAGGSTSVVNGGQYEYYLDFVYGGGGSDWLIGGKGFDVIDGGEHGLDANVTDYDTAIDIDYDGDGIVDYVATVDLTYEYGDTVSYATADEGGVIVDLTLQEYYGRQSTTINGTSIDYLTPEGFFAKQTDGVYVNAPNGAMQTLDGYFFATTDDGTSTGSSFNFGDILIGIENVWGSSDSDSITGDANDNVINPGTDGDDTVHGGAGTDTLDLRNRDETNGVILNASASAQGSIAANAIFYDGATGNAASISGFEVYFDTPYADEIYGSSANETFNLSGGADFVDAGAGNDLIKVTALDADVGFVGGTGSDSLDLVDLDFSGETIDFDAATDTYTVKFSDTTATITFTGFEDVDGIDVVWSGTAADDSLVGGSADENIFAGGGDDTLDGGDGQNVLVGGTGDDSLIGGIDADAMYGGDGDDTLTSNGSGDSQTELMLGQDGDDLITFDATGNDGSFFEGTGGEGDDTITSNASERSILDGEAGNDYLEDYGIGDAYLYGGDGQDVLVSSNATAANGSVVYGEAGMDVVFFTPNGSSSNIISGGLTSGDDGSDDVLVIDDDTGVTLDGTTITDRNGATLSYHDFNIVILTDQGDSISSFEAGSSIDFLSTGAGDDVIHTIAGSGVAKVDLGSGDDYVYATATTDVVLYGGSGLDELEVPIALFTADGYDVQPDYTKVTLTNGISYTLIDFEVVGLLLDSGFVSKGLVAGNSRNDTPIWMMDAASISAQENQDGAVHKSAMFALDTGSTFDPDSSGGALTFSLSGEDASSFTIDPSTGSISFVDEPDYEAWADVDGDNEYVIEVTATDDDGDLATQTVSIELTDEVNEAPNEVIIIDGDGNSDIFGGTEGPDIDEGWTGTVAVLGASDDEGDDITLTVDDTRFSISKSQSEGYYYLDLNTALDYETDGANVVVKIEAGDDDGTTVTTYTLTLADVSEAVTFDATQSWSASFYENADIATAVFTASASGNDLGDTLTYSLTGGADQSAFTIDASTGKVFFIASPDYETPTDADADNTYEVDVTASDSSSSATKTLSVSVIDLAEAATIVSSAVSSVNENTDAVVHTVSAFDNDGDNLTFGLEGDDANLLTIDETTGEITFVSAPDAENPGDRDGDNVYTVDVIVTDDSLTKERTAQAVTIAVTDANEAPSGLAVYETTSVSGERLDPSVALNDAEIVVASADDVAFGATEGDVLATLTRNEADQKGAVLTGDAFAVDKDFRLSAELYFGDDDAGGKGIILDLLPLQTGSYDNALSLAHIKTGDGTADSIDVSYGSDASLNANVEDGAWHTLTLDYVAAAGTLTLTFDGTEHIGTGVDLASALGSAQAVAGFSATTDSTFFNLQMVRNVAFTGTLIDGTAAITAINENVDGATVGYLNGSDEDGDDLSYTTSDARFEIVDNALLKLKSGVSLNHESEATISVDVVVDDGSAQATETLVFAVDDAPEAPEFTSATTTTIAENTTGVVYTAAVIDPDGDSVAFSLAGEDAGLFTINADGNVSLATSLDYEAPTDADRDGEYVIDIVATDGSTNALQTSQTVAIVVADVEEAPSVELTAGLVEENVAGAVIGALSVAGSGAVMISVSDPRFEIASDGTTLQLAAGQTLNYETDADDDGHVIVEIFAEAVNGLDSTTAVAFALTDVNDAPVIEGDLAITVTEDDPEVFRITVTDEDGDDVSHFTAEGGDPSNGSLFTYVTSSGNRGYRYSPDANFYGTDAFTLVAYDVNGASDEMTVAVTVEPQDDQAELTVTDLAAIAENQTAAQDVATLALFDIEGDQYTLSLTSYGWDGDEGRWTDGFAVAANDDGTWTLRYDGTTPFDHETVSGVSVGLLATPLVEPDNSYQGGIAYFAVGIEIADVPEPAVFSGDFAVSISTQDADDQIYASEFGAYSAIDEDDDDGLRRETLTGDYGTLQTETRRDEETATGQDDFFSYTLGDQSIQDAIGASGVTETFTLTSNGGDTQALTIDVIGVADAATDLTLDNWTVAENEAGAVVGALSVTDPDTMGAAGHKFTAFEADGTGSLAVSTRFVVSDTGVISLADGVSLDREVEPTVILTIEVADVENASATYAEAFAITVEDANEGLTATADRIDTLEDIAVEIDATTLLANDVDDDGDSLAVISVADAQDGAVTLSGNTIVFRPDADFAGEASFIYTVADGRGALDTATVLVAVAAVDDAPVTSRVDLGTMAEDGISTISEADLLAGVLDVDSDAAGLRVTSLAIASGSGALTNEGDASWTYAGAANDDTEVTFTFYVTDGTSMVAGSAYLDLTSVNDAPVAENDTAVTNEDVALDIAFADLVANDEDADGDALSLIAARATAGGSVALVDTDADGEDDVVRFAPEPDFNGQATFDYTVSDDNGETSTATVTVSVTEVNDAPVADNENYNVKQGTSLSVAVSSGVLAGDVDPDGDALTASVLDDVADGTLLLSGDGSFVYTPTVDFVGTSTFTYTVSDGNGGTDSGTVSIAVDPVNVIDGDDARNTVTGGSGSDLVFAAGGNDIVKGLAGDDTINGGDGNDVIRGGDDNDQLFGENDRDSLFGGRGDDFLDGGNGRDRLLGGSDNDSIDGGASRDRMYGGSGTDTLIGGDGDDVIYVDRASERYTLERNGTDVVLFDKDDGIDRIFGFEADDLIVLLDGTSDLSIAITGSGDTIIRYGETKVTVFDVELGAANFNDDISMLS